MTSYSLKWSHYTLDIHLYRLTPATQGNKRSNSPRKKMCHYDDPDLLTCQSCRTPYSDPSTWELITNCTTFLTGPRVLFNCSEAPTFPGRSFGVTPEGDLCRRCTIIQKAREADKDRKSSSSSSSEPTPDPYPNTAAVNDYNPHRTREQERLARMRTARMSRWTAHGMSAAHAGRAVNAEGNQGEGSECVPRGCPFASKCRYGCGSMQARLVTQQMDNMLLRRRRSEDLVGAGGDGDGDEVLLLLLSPVPRCPFTYYCPIKCMGMYLRNLE
ncbi:hypothetical protein MCOR25_009087 [Pyricularia grisea]|nr:hypothetical protein MCOR25_009087 [Pyricularia grisea]